MADDLATLLQSNRSASVLQGIANPPQINPLAAMNSAVSAATGVYNLRGAQANEALGDAYRQAVDPATGRFDPLKFNQLAAGNERTSLAAKAGIESSQALQGAQQTQNAALQSQIHGAVVAALASPNANLTQSVLEQVARLRAAGAPQDRLDAALMNLSRHPEELRQQLETIRVQSLPPAQQEQNIYGTTFRENIGGAIIGGTQQPASRGGGIGGGAGITTGMSAETLGARVTWEDPNTGQKRNTTYEEYLIANGIPYPRGGQPTGAPGGRPMPGGPAPGAPAPGTSSMQPGVTGQTPPRLQAAPATPVPGTPGSGVPRSGPGGPKPDDEAVWRDSRDKYNAASTSAGGYLQRVAPLAQAYQILKDNPDITTGKGAEALNDIKSWIMTHATAFLPPGVSAQTLGQAKFDEVVKYMQQYVNGQGLSGRSDAAMASAVSGNPSAHISTIANHQIIPVMIGTERMNQMIHADFQKSGRSPNEWTKYVADWQNRHDPRAFVFDMLDADKRKAIVASLKTPEQRAAFNRTLDIVERNPGVMRMATMPAGG